MEPILKSREKLIIAKKSVKKVDRVTRLGTLWPIEPLFTVRSFFPQKVMFCF
jgi:hypothetical protein